MGINSPGWQRQNVLVYFHLSRRTNRNTPTRVRSPCVWVVVGCRSGGAGWVFVKIYCLTSSITVNVTDNIVLNITICLNTSDYVGRILALNCPLVGHEFSAIGDQCFGGV